MKTFKEWLAIETKTDSILVYHITSTKNLKSILSQGLVPKVKKRAWEDDQNTSFHGPSRNSLEGIYVSTNLNVCRMAHGNKDDDKLIIVAKIQPKTGYVDEDKFNILSSPSTNEYIAANLYASIKTGKNNELIKQYFDKYQNTFQKLTNDLKRPLNTNLVNRLNVLLWDTFISAINRQAAYLDNSDFQSVKSYGVNLEAPNKQEVEMDFLHKKEQLTKTVKILANPFAYKEEPFNFTSRIMEPIKFVGPNKIVAIVHEPKSRKSAELVYTDGSWDLNQLP